MDDPQPKVRCLDCGFLHGVARSGVTRDDVYFDPDILRKADITNNISAHDYQITSRPYHILTDKLVHKWSGGPGTTSRYGVGLADKVEAISYTWDNCAAIGCFRNVWKVAVTWEKGEVGPASTDQITNEIQKERDCPHYFPYTPGLSVSHHSEDQREARRAALEDQREERRLERELDLQRGLAEQSQRLAQQSQIIQWVAIGISAISLLISVGAPLLIDRTTKVVITAPIIMVEPTATATLTSTPASTPTLTGPTPTP